MRIWLPTAPLAFRRIGAGGGAVFFGGIASEETKKEVEGDLAKGARAFAKLAKFDPRIAGRKLTLADCAAFVSLPLISMATKIAYDKDVLESVPQVKSYLKMFGERPHFKKVIDNRKAALEAAAAAAAKAKSGA